MNLFGISGGRKNGVFFSWEKINSKGVATNILNRLRLEIILN